MGIPVETERPWEMIGDHIHYDRRLNTYSHALRDQVIQQVERIRKKTGVGHVEAIPYQWELDQNFSSILIRGETSEGRVHEVFTMEPVQSSQEWQLKAKVATASSK